MAHLNYYLIGATLGATIGPRLPGNVGPVTYGPIARKMLHALRLRQPFVTELGDYGSAAGRLVKRVRAALEAARDGFSPDRVIADPEMNKSFLERCETFGIEHDAFYLNRTVLALRKAGELRGLQSKRTIVRDQWRYAFATEIAGRAICLRYGVSIDTMLCHPKLAREFDELAAKLAPETTVFECRWCALNIRKRGLTGLDAAQRRIKELRWSRRDFLKHLHRIPQKPGICELFEEDRLLFVCESGNLHERAESHRGAMTCPPLDRDLWNPRPERLFWRYSVTGDNGADRPALVSALVGQHSPVFNIPRAVRIRAA